jgi:hypothetical protein
VTSRRLSHILSHYRFSCYAKLKGYSKNASNRLIRRAGKNIKEA